jgi:two-component system, cell cycle response regulator DivK
VTRRAPRVLLVDDNEVNRYLAQFVLEQDGFEVRCAGDGETALAMARADPPDLVLMDLRMPGLDGYACTERLRAEPALAQVPVLAVSAQVMPAERARALAVGCVAHLEKPIDPLRFAQQVRAWLPAGVARGPG